MERLAREKIATQQRLAELKNELSQWMDILEIDRIIRQTVQPEDDQASTSTASGTRNYSLLDHHCMSLTQLYSGGGDLHLAPSRFLCIQNKVKGFQVFCNH